MSDKFGFGIIGAGVVSAYHANALEAVPEAKIVAVAANQGADVFAAKHNCEVVPDWREMIKRPDIQFVNICTPSWLHAEQAIAALRAGKHVIVEKPMAINLKGASEMNRAARENGVKLAVIYQKRTEEAPIKIRKAIQGGLLGKMVFGDASIKYWRNQAYYDGGDWRGKWATDGGGSSMNQGSHGIDILLYMMGDVEKIYAKIDTVAHKIEVEDVAIAILTYKNGAYGRLATATAVNPGIGNVYEFNGTLGTIMLNEDSITSWAVSDSKEVLAKETVKYVKPVASSAASSPTQFTHDGFRKQMVNLIAAATKGEELICSGEEGFKSVQLILGIYESARRKEEIYLDELLEKL
jgi:UDP-N-acetyl-2-amino-2-deoxyglucuronate dehydrogenase